VASVEAVPAERLDLVGEVFGDPEGFAALFAAAIEHRALGAFVARARERLDAGELSADVVRAADSGFAGALALLPVDSPIAGAVEELATSVGLAARSAARPPRLRDRLVPATEAIEMTRWERERSFGAHSALFESIGHPAPAYFYPFRAAVKLKCLTVITPDRQPVAHGSWLVALELLAEAMLAVDDALAKASIPRPEPNPDPFGLRKSRGDDTPAAKRFETVVETLGPALEKTCPWAAERADDAVAELLGPGQQADPDEVRAGVLAALAAGVAHHHAVYRVRVAPFEGLVDALESGGAYRKPKRPSLAALRRAHPKLAYWPLRALDGPPRRATDSCVARGDHARCPVLAPDEVPTDDSGAPLDFVFQLALGGMRGLPKGFAHDAALIAVFDGARREVVALAADAVEARVDREVPAGVVALATGRKATEPPSAEWIRRVDPAQLEGRQSPHDVETLLGHWIHRTREAHHTTSKIGGTYTPVQPWATCLPDTGADHLVVQLDFDDGAPLPDAGLLYVVAMEDGGFFVGDEHT